MSWMELGKRSSGMPPTPVSVSSSQSLLAIAYGLIFTTLGCLLCYLRSNEFHRDLSLEITLHAVLPISFAVWSITLLPFEPSSSFRKCLGKMPDVGIRVTISVVSVTICSCFLLMQSQVVESSVWRNLLLVAVCMIGLAFLFYSLFRFITAGLYWFPPIIGSAFLVGFAIVCAPLR